MFRHSTDARRRRRGSAVLLVSCLLLASCGDDDDTTSDSAAPDASDAAAESPEGPVVVASTSWVAAIAELAGASDVAFIAPSSVQHPPDYEPTASDLAAVTEADFVVMAGFEGFAERLSEAAGDATVITIAPTYSPATLKPEVDKLAVAFGTEEAAGENFAAYTAGWDQAAADTSAATAGGEQVVVAQAFMTEWVAFAGYDVAGTYGPAPATATEIADLVDLAPTLIVDNVHMGGGAEVADASGGTLLPLANFPGDDLDLLAVIDANAAAIVAAGGVDGATAEGDGESDGDEASGTVFPLTIENCGRTLTFDAPPERVVGIDQISTEVLLQLGVGASVVGTANQSDPAFEEFADEFATVPVLSANYPTAEELVAAEPDLVVGNLEFLSFSQESGFGGPLTRDELDSRGANSFALICTGEEDTMPLLFDRFQQLGEIFDVAATADAEVAEAQSALDDAAALLQGVDPVPTLIYIDGQGPIQTLGSALEHVGGTNILAPDEGGCCPPEIGLEAVVERNPAAVLVTSFGNLDPSGPSFDDKVAALAALLPTVPALQNERYLAIDFIAFSTPARIARDVVTVGAFLHPDLGFPS